MQEKIIFDNADYVCVQFGYFYNNMFVYAIIHLCLQKIKENATEVCEITKNKSHTLYFIFSYTLMHYITDCVYDTSKECVSNH
jgi:hypothetical protein